MDQKTYITASGVRFFLIALLHVLRVAYGWEAAIGGYILPMWLSWAGVAISAYLAYSAYQLIQQHR
jgi:hypothetical protein